MWDYLIHKRNKKMARKETPEERAERIKKITQQIREGTYKTNSESIARAVMDKDNRDDADFSQEKIVRSLRNPFPFSIWPSGNMNKGIGDLMNAVAQGGISSNPLGAVARDLGAVGGIVGGAAAAGKIAANSGDIGRGLMRQYAQNDPRSKVSDAPSPEFTEDKTSRVKRVGGTGRPSGLGKRKIVSNPE